jgi:hypothetical protein
MHKNFEAVGDMADWPTNVPGKPTQAAVFGMYQEKKGKRFELLWTGKFPDLEPALYWAAKKEIQAVRKDKWMMASRVVWQHDLTPEQAAEVARKTMEPQVDAAIMTLKGGGAAVDIGPGPMRVVRPDESVPRYMEIAPEGGGDPLASFALPAQPLPEALRDLLNQGPEPDEDLWLPPDPRRPPPGPKAP